MRENFHLSTKDTYFSFNDCFWRLKFSIIITRTLNYRQEMLEMPKECSVSVQVGQA